MFIRDYFNIIKTEDQAIEYLIDKKVISATKTCYSCKNVMTLNITSKMYVCKKRLCNKKVSKFKGTFFASCRFKIHICLDLCFLYLNKLPIIQITQLTGLSSATVTEWTHFLRQLLGESLEPTTMKIGGPGIEVEIDEIKMGKRKYHREHHVEGVWVVCGVERTEKKIFCY